MRILGIDPGLGTLGWGVIDTDGVKHRVVQYGAILTTPGEALPQRLRAIFKSVTQLMETFQPDEVAFEELFFSKNITTGMAVSAARGVALVAVAEKTDKHQIQTMVRMMLSLGEIPRPDDAADALAVAITHANSMRAGQMFKIK